MIVIRNIQTGEAVVVKNYHEVTSFMWGRDIELFQFAPVVKWLEFENRDITRIREQVAQEYQKAKEEKGGEK